MGKRERRAPPQARASYRIGAALSPLIPMVVEQTAQGERTFHIYSRLLKQSCPVPC